MTLAWDLLIRAFLGRGEDCPTHCDNWIFVSTLYPYTHVSSPALGNLSQYSLGVITLHMSCHGPHSIPLLTDVAQT